MQDTADSIAPRRGAGDRRFWAYAAAFGAAWGSLEIVIGSFLHSLHIPFAGPLLAATGAALLVAERQLLPLRGLSLATGLVAATCKSLSPGGVILGPMVGITVEAALMELLLLIIGANVVGAALGGVLSVVWATSQKVLVQVLLYGGDIWSLYVAAVRKTSGLVGVREAAGWMVLAAVIALLSLIGAASGVIGVSAGRECRRLLAARRVTA